MLLSVSLCPHINVLNLSHYYYTVCKQAFDYQCYHKGL